MYAPDNPPVCMAPEYHGATVLRDRRIADYEARLRNSQTQAPVVPDTGYEDPYPVSTTGTGLLRGATSYSPCRLAGLLGWQPILWTANGLTAHRLTNSSLGLASATRYGVHDRDRVVEPIGLGITRQPAPQPRYQASMEMPDSLFEGEETDEGYVGYPPLSREIRL